MSTVVCSLGTRDARRGFSPARYGHRCDPETGAAFALDAEADDADREAGMNELWPTQSQDVPASVRGLRAGDDDEDGHDAEANRADEEAPLGGAESESLTGELRAATKTRTLRTCRMTGTSLSKAARRIDDDRAPRPRI